MNIDHLNNEFGIKGQLQFISGKGSFPIIVIENAKASARISSYAAQILSFQPAHAGDDLLFLSEQAYYQPGKAIKGGIPICWPWFGSATDGSEKPAHGFVRNQPWDVLSTRALDDGSTEVKLGISETRESLEIWPHCFQLTAVITVGTSLSIELISHNNDAEAVIIGQALHTYFAVGDISKVSVLGLEQRAYFDKADQGLQKHQSGPVVIDAEVDRIYVDVENALVIEDKSLGRKIHISSSGSKTAVVWNPWVDIAAAMGDLKNDAFRHMLCVETVNTGDDRITLLPADEYHLKVNYSIE